MKEYIKTIYSIERNGDVAKTTELAKKLHVKPASVTEMTRKMGAMGLLYYRPYHQMKLTERAYGAATKILRQYRLLEKLFVDFLGLDATSACSEASKLELLLSDHAINRICAVFNHQQLTLAANQFTKMKNAVGDEKTIPQLPSQSKR